MSLRRISTLSFLPTFNSRPSHSCYTSLSSSHGERSFVEEGKNSSFLLQSLSPPLSIAIRTCIPPPPQGRLLEGGKRGENAVVMQVSLWSSNFSHQKTRQGGYTHSGSPASVYEFATATMGEKKPKERKGQKENRVRKERFLILTKNIKGLQLKHELKLKIFSPMPARLLFPAGSLSQ